MTGGKAKKDGCKERLRRAREIGGKTGLTVEVHPIKIICGGPSKLYSRFANFSVVAMVVTGMPSGPAE